MSKETLNSTDIRCLIVTKNVPQMTKAANARVMLLVSRFLRKRNIKNLHSGFMVLTFKINGRYLASYVNQSPCVCILTRFGQIFTNFTKSLRYVPAEKFYYFIVVAKPASFVYLFIHFFFKSKTSLRKKIKNALLVIRNWDCIDATGSRVCDLFKIRSWTRRFHGIIAYLLR